jgi:hypothetical protein
MEIGSGELTEKLFDGPATAGHHFFCAAGPKGYLIAT